MIVMMDFAIWVYPIGCEGGGEVGFPCFPDGRGFWVGEGYDEKAENRRGPLATQ